MVRAWQSFLTEKDFPVSAVDGDFGRMSEQATRSYEQRNGLPVNGVVDTATYAKALEQGFLFKLPNLTANLLLSYLGFGEAEVVDLQRSLNIVAQLTPALTADGDFGPTSTKGLAEAYKKRDVRLRDELEAQLAAATKQKLGDDFEPALDIFNQFAKIQRFRLSGPYWVEDFPTSRLITDLASPFRERVQAFQKALLDAGAQVIVAATFRPRERAYLMHYCARISRQNISADDVPPMPGVDIDWVHYTNAGSVQAAQQMADAYGVGGNPVALTSRHTQRLAVDWNVTWEGVMNIRDASGNIVRVGEPRNAANNQTLWRVGRSYGVIKLPNDPPHWSNDGA
jgi:hypothetical protein